MQQRLTGRNQRTKENLLSTLQMNKIPLAFLSKVQCLGAETSKQIHECRQTTKQIIIKKKIRSKIQQK